MRVLVAVRHGIEGWRQAMQSSTTRMRRTDAYVFGGAFFKRGHQVVGCDFGPDARAQDAVPPFAGIRTRAEFGAALREADAALLWASWDAVRAIAFQCLRERRRRNVFLCSFVLGGSGGRGLRRRLVNRGLETAASFARAVVVTTAEQALALSRKLGSRVPAIRLTWGVDTAFFLQETTVAGLPQSFASVVDEITSKPYMIMTGDQLRQDRDAIDLVRSCDVRIVRVLMSREFAEPIRSAVAEKGVGDHYFILQAVPDVVYRFLMQRAHAYLGLVDSTWQPAGWTSACEALACGLPAILYEGLVSRELEGLGAGKYLRNVHAGDVRGLRKQAEGVSSWAVGAGGMQGAKEFAARTLDIDVASEQFVKDVERLIGQT